jgi:hypothetical protein
MSRKALAAGSENVSDGHRVQSSKNPTLARLGSVADPNTLQTDAQSLIFIGT